MEVDTAIALQIPLETEGGPVNPGKDPENGHGVLLLLVFLFFFFSTFFRATWWTTTVEIPPPDELEGLDQWDDRHFKNNEYFQIQIHKPAHHGWRLARGNSCGSSSWVERAGKR